jgi:hypothetical protein
MKDEKPEEIWIDKQEILMRFILATALTNWKQIIPLRVLVRKFFIKNLTSEFIEQLCKQNQTAFPERNSNTP